MLGLLPNDELERMLTGEIVTHFKIMFQNLLEGQKKTTKDFIQDSTYP